MDNAKSLSRRSFVAAGAVTAGAAALGLSACGGGSSNNTSNTANTNSSGTAAKGGTLTGAAAYSSTNYNPIGNSSALVLGAIWHVFEGLYELDLHNYTTYPALAKEAPKKISDTQYEITLRDGAKFSDGTAVTAADVVNAFQLNMADATYSAMLEFIDSVAAKDDTTVTLTLKYAFADLLEGRLAIVKIFPATQTVDDLKVMPIGSGPWMYDKINGDEGGAIDFLPNPNYNGSYPASADKMHWDVLKDATARTTALQEGSVMVMESVPDANVDQLTAAGATIEYVQGFNQAFLMFNTKKAPFDDYRVRQAFYYAINVEKLISNAMAGNATAITSFLPKEHANYHQAATVYTYDPEKAKSLLAEAGVSNLTFTLMCNNNWVQDLSAQIKEDLDAVLGSGACTLNVTTIAWQELAASDSILPYDVMLTPGDPTCFGNDPDLLMSWWYGDNIWTQGRSCWNYTAEWAQLQDYMQQARVASGSAQQELWNKCFDLLAEQVPLYPLFHRKLATGYLPKKITGFAPIATTGLVFIGASCAQ
ncbi:MAG: ABC transporter substrate-binding protein [Coriobacteriia bacterium]|nr:ABC transporter substrate-binding protein [Coriobacteriia bacterium]